MEVTKFSTGAIRSTDANDTSFYLISPIALRRIATVYAQRNSNYRSSLSNALSHQLDYLSGDRHTDHLAWAAYHLLEHIGPTTTESDGDDVIRYDLISYKGLEALAKTYREGELKYSAYNCERGMPIHDLLNHALRHQWLYSSGDRTEDHLGHTLWGLCIAMHSEEIWPHLNRGYLRGPNLSLTDDINRKIDEARIAKLIKKVSEVKDDETQLLLDNEQWDKLQVCLISKGFINLAQDVQEIITLKGKYE